MGNKSDKGNHIEIIHSKVYFLLVSGSITRAQSKDRAWNQI